MPHGARVLRVNLKSVTNVNSGGVRSWIQWLNSLSSDLDRKFEECSLAVTQQAMNIANFLLGSIVSYYVPYFCDHCNKDASLLVVAPALPAATCPCGECNGSMTLDVPMEMLAGLFDKPSTSSRPLDPRRSNLM
jgi:hypothetical protein